MTQAAFLLGAEGVVATHSPTRVREGGAIPTSALHIHLGRTDDARWLIRRFHYSHRMPSAAAFIATWHRSGGLFGDSGEAIAACVIRTPPTRWAEPVYELSRLVLVEGEPRPPLTVFLKGVMALAKRRGFDLLVSFADRTVGHHGGIYQASSWNYDGLRANSMDGVIYGGKFVPGRMANNLWGTRSPERLAAKGITVEPHFDEGKHLYWKALNAEGIAKAKRLGLDSQPYPKAVGT